MDLSTQQRIELEHLLLQREGAYTRVHQAEVEIAKIFGEGYPLPPPPEPVAVDPAMRKKKRKPRPSPKKKTTPKIRTLDADESAYRIGLLQEGSQFEESHVDRKSIQSLFKTGAADQILLWIETVDKAGQRVERIYERDEG